MIPLQEGEVQIVRQYRNKRGEIRAYKTIENASASRRRVRSIGKQRYQRSERALGLLGGLYDSIHLRVESKVVIVFSGPRWSGVHNSGGRAGHGANIKKRQFLKIDVANVMR